MNKRNDLGRTIRNIGIFIGVPLLFLIGFWLLFRQKANNTGTVYSDYLNLFYNNQVAEGTLDLGKGELKVLIRDTERANIPKKFNMTKEGYIVYKVPDVGIFYQDMNPWIQERIRAGDPAQRIKFDYIASTEIPWLINLIPYVLLGGLFIAMWVMMRRSMSSIDGGKTMGFGRARVKHPSEDKRKTTFADVAGADEEKEELRELVYFLKSPKKFTELGARVPKGVLLVGPPGTGKTLLARAVAGEAGVPFFSISGSDFVEMYVGVGASRVRDLFEQAKKNAPCIIFIDEIDAVGRQRGAGLGGGHDEREQTLNQLLVEMDGFSANEGVIMIAATNRPDILDPALMRPGRFDRQIVVNYPDIKGREEILKVHARGKPLAPDVDLSVIAKTTVGFTGADLENVLNEAALLAARRGLHAITMNEIEEATIKVLVGTEKRSHVITEKDKRITAYHEAGHAIVSYFCPTQDPVHQVSIIPRGMAAGYTLNLPQEDRTHKLKTEMMEEIEVLLSGRVAEQLVIGDITTGASNDIQRATETARKMVTKFGMSDELGPIMFGTGSNEVFLGRDLGHTRNYSEAVAAKIDQEVEKIINRAYENAKKILSEHIDKLHQVAAHLIEHEKIDGEEFIRLMNSPTPSPSPTA